MTNDAAVSGYGLVVEEKHLGVGELELQKPAREAGVALAQHGLAPDEVANRPRRFSTFTAKPSPASST